MTSYTNFKLRLKFLIRCAWLKTIIVRGNITIAQAIFINEFNVSYQYRQAC